jgi:glucose/arabinose dehydrogenase
MLRTLIVVSACLIGAVVLTGLLLPVNVPLTGWLFGSRADYAQDTELQTRITLPPGYRINIYATGIDDARFMQLTPTGDLLVTSTDDGTLVLVKRDANGDGRSDGVEVLASGMELPHGIWLDGKTLYIAEEHQVIRYSYEPLSRVLSSRKVVLEGLPAGDGHHTRTVKKGPDGWLYVSIGSSCNVCIEEHPWRAAIIRFKPGAGEPEVFATGLRNTVGFDWQPGTGLMYGVNNGRDWLGDDFPPEEMNQIVQGGFYGWPFFNGDNMPDEDHGADPVAATLTPIAPVHNFKAHVAPLSITFLNHQAGTPLEGAALVGQHGSWNSDSKVGYRIVSLHWDETGVITQKTFAEGFEQDGDVIGRPVEAIDGPDGTLYISDDFAGVIYRVTRDGGG